MDEIYFRQRVVILKIIVDQVLPFDTFALVNTYFTQQEDGSFRPVTFNQSNLADILADVITQEFKSALADKVRGLIDATDISGKVSEALDGVDIDDIASEAVRDEVNARVENLDISVDVSI
jgi:hypothetical protein